MSRNIAAVMTCCGLLSLLHSAFPDDKPSTPAANAEVEKVIREFQGKGQLGDDTPELAPEVALKHFQPADDIKVELVAAEPDVMQPLHLSFDEQGRMWVTQYRQYPLPAGLKIVRYDQYLRAVFDDVPRPPPHHVPGADVITVFEDTNNDGVYDAHRDVIKDLNIATATVTGRGGIWVMNPPYLMFYPDADNDGIPDGDPEVKLRGFGLEDTHALANSLTWGPDGWLYGAMGSTTTAQVSSKVNQDVRFEGQCIWRFHPDTDVFEVFAEGGGNTFSLEFDGTGRLFSGTNAGDTRGMFYPQGSYGEKNFGKHGPLTNPYAFGYFPHMKHEGDPDRFAQTFLIYEGGTLPEKYHGRIIAANALHHRVWASDLISEGSTYRTADIPTLLKTDDTWFRPVDIKAGPDGAVYMADWYDTRLSHVDPRDTWHKSSGRIYRIQNAATPSGPIPNLTKDSDDELIARFRSPNKWERQTAVRLLADRLRPSQDSPTQQKLLAAIGADQPDSLESLWTLASAGKLDDEVLRSVLTHPQEEMRRWAVRLLGDARQVSPETASALASLASTEPQVQVRSQLASSSARFETDVALPILTALMKHDADLNDPHLPLLIWWGLEAHCGECVLNHSQHVGVLLNSISKSSPREQVLQLLKSTDVWQSPLFQQAIAARLMRRFALEGIQEQKASAPSPALLACEQLLAVAPPESAPILMSGFLEAYQGREIGKLPNGLKLAIQDYQKSLGESNLVLGIRLGDAKSVTDAVEAIRNEQGDLPTRLAIIETFGEVDCPQSVPGLLAVLQSPSSGVKKAALQALMRYPEANIGAQICSLFQSSLPDEHGLRESAFRVLASRIPWTAQLLSEIEQHRLPRNAVPNDIVQQLRLHPDEKLQERVNQIWGRTRETSAEKAAEITRLKSLLSTSAVTAENLANGKKLFTKHCANCHTLFSEGGQIGPNLTGYERSNTDFILLAIVDPSAGIREEFVQFQLATEDGRILTGLIVEQSPTSVTLKGANNQTTTLPREEIEILQAMTTSLMPEGLLKDLSDEDRIALLQYLMQPTPSQTPKSE
ncbi:PVC-type heme-binding CxxCH protein [Planctomicrobium sp. SH661]|uniref:PVC-type heme-binding CxxCH protein n=1 Tax=Planctomicrobium sp. SH661 TaxID=3448124 RepID=UPI003F5B4BE2